MSTSAFPSLHRAPKRPLLHPRPHHLQHQHLPYQHFHPTATPPPPKRRCTAPISVVLNDSPGPHLPLHHPPLELLVIPPPKPTPSPAAAAVKPTTIPHRYIPPTPHSAHSPDGLRPDSLSPIATNHRHQPCAFAPSPAAVAANVDKFTKSRAVGQSHRDNQRNHIYSLTRAVKKGHCENVFLVTLFLGSNDQDRQPTSCKGIQQQQHHSAISSTSSTSRIDHYSRTAMEQDDEDYDTDPSMNPASCNVEEQQQQQQHQQQQQQDDDDDDDDDEEGTGSCVIHSHMAFDEREDHGVTSDEVARSFGLIKLSLPTAMLMGQMYISPELASCMLDMVISRRNLVSQEPDACDEGRPRRRRNSYKSATTWRQVSRILEFTVHNLTERGRWRQLEDLERFVDRKLGALGKLFARFDDVECTPDAICYGGDNAHGLCSSNSSKDEAQQPRCDARQLLQHQQDQQHEHEQQDQQRDSSSNSPPESPTRPAAAEFESPAAATRRRGEGAKRCSRCHKLKTTGSGHGRSKCDDGYSISSPVAYPATFVRCPATPPRTPVGQWWVAK